MTIPIAVSDIENTITRYLPEPETPSRIYVLYMAKLFYDEKYVKLLKTENNKNISSTWKKIILPKIIRGSSKEEDMIASEICYNYLIANLDPKFYDFRSDIYGYGGLLHLISLLPDNIVERLRNEFELGKSRGVHYHTKSYQGLNKTIFDGERNFTRKFKSDFAKSVKSKNSDAILFGFGDNEKDDTHMNLCEKQFQFWVDNSFNGYKNGSFGSFGKKEEEMKNILERKGLKFNPRRFKRIFSRRVFEKKMEVSEARYKNFEDIYFGDFDYKFFLNVLEALELEEEIKANIKHLSQGEACDFIEEKTSDEYDLTIAIYNKIIFDISLEDLVTNYKTC